MMIKRHLPQPRHRERPGALCGSGVPAPAARHPTAVPGGQDQFGSATHHGSDGQTHTGPQIR
uniref:Aerolysin regulatory protein n=1 Tax=Aeromonas sobria TaxID=646 RepID=AERC_AERSO|nr:RecName: Full=Aerolysin regulatory protein [Aeromonas sobria]CAA68641.1 unnamed protein product [Aeromonas sobria]